MGHSLCPFQSLGLPEPGRAGWRSMVGAHGQPAPCPVHCNPSKAAAATRWQHPSHTLLFHTSPNSGAYLQASKRVSRLGTGAPLLFLGLTEGMRGSDLYHPSHPPPTSSPQNTAACLLAYSGRIQEETQKSSTLVPVFNSRSQLLKILAPHLFLQVPLLKALGAWVSDRGRRWRQTLPAT